MKIIDIKKNIEKILDNNKAANIISINLKNKLINVSSSSIKKKYSQKYL